MLTLILSSIGFAVPLQVTQQGRILDGNGAGVSGLHDLTFRIYDAETSGTLLWEETITETMTNGYYAAVLGADETNNPLDSNILELYPIYLEFQLDSNSPVGTRQAINSAPYAQIAGKAEVATSVNGGSVNATDVQISGNPVIDGTGSWVGQPITVDWNNIDPSTIPSYIADGDDNTQLSKTEVLNYVNGETLNLGASSQVDGSDIVTADSFSTYLPADADTLASLNCATGEIASWDGNSSWVCTSDNTLEWADIELLLNNNPVDLNASTTIGGAEIITTVDDADTLASLSCSDGEIAKYDSGLGDWYCDVDVDTTLTSTEVTTMVEAGSVNLATGSQVNSRNIVSQPTTCTNGQVLVYNSTSSDWECGDDTDTTLTPTEMQAAVEAMSLNLQNLPQVNGVDVLTADSTLDPANIDASSATTDQVLKYDGSSVTWGSASTEGCTAELISSSVDNYTLMSCGSSSILFSNDGTQTSYSTHGDSGWNVNNFHCGLKSSGKIRCWGRDDVGQVSNAPSGIFKKIAIGYEHVCAINDSDKVVCWGNNGWGQTNAPTGSDTYIDIYSGSYHSCGIKSNQQAYCWGKNNNGQLSVPGGSYTKIAANHYTNCGLLTNGTISCWGRDGYGEVSNAPSGTFTDIELGEYYACALSISGNIECWGYDSHGQVSDTPTGTYTKLSVSAEYACALNTSDEIECWGNYNGLPTGSFSDVETTRFNTCGIKTSGEVECAGFGNSPVQPPSNGNFTCLFGEYGSMCGLLDKGHLICWGANTYEQSSGVP